ncbi:MAG: metallophosphoesterase, partial [Planctomycetes bacterium]|nr:metallophosphoesterase [Planctomycetota bacterium]
MLNRLLWVLALAAGWASENSTAHGVVYNDLNHDGKRGVHEPGLRGVRVSNGVDIVKTDRDGRWQLPVLDAPCEFFVLKPEGWMVPLTDQNVPQFFYVHRPLGSPNMRFAGVEPTGPLPDSIDFPLVPHDESGPFRALMVGDPQPRDLQEVAWLSHDIAENFADWSGAFAVTLGDITFDNLSLFEPLNQMWAQVGVPWWQVIGNHDVNRDVKDDAWSAESYARFYGPTTYSFDWGSAHFLVLDNVFYPKPEPGKNLDGYQGFLTERVLQFAKNDLAAVSKDKLVVVLMHIPFYNTGNAGDFYRLLEPFPFALSVAGHMHTHENHFLDQDDGWRGAEPHHHVVNVTACGSWFTGAPDEQGIPHTTMRDGAPNGVSVFEFDGVGYGIEFVPARRPASQQMTLHLADFILPEELRSETGVRFHANVFNGSERSIVRWRIDDGDWASMTKVLEPDPLYEETRLRENSVLGSEKPFA